MRRPWASFVSVLCALVGCGEPEVILTVDDMTLFALDGPCAPADPIARIDVTALGDFPASDARVATLELGQSEERITRFPLDTELLTVRAVNPSWEGVATPAYVRGDITREVLLLPLGRSCELPAAEINLPVDGAATALTGGAFLIAGGAVSEPSVDCPSGFAEGTRRAVLVGPDGRVAAVIALLTPRLGATATFAKGRAVIVGGSPYQCDAALDTFEMLDATQPNPVFETFRLCPDELDECVGRRDHGAGVLADGRILVYGGIQRAGVPDAVLDTGLIIDPANPGVVETDLNYEIDPGTFMPRRRFAQILTLDNGLTILTGGRGVLDATQEWQGEAYAFDPTTNRFMRVDTGSKDDKFYPTTDGTGAGRLDPVPAVVLPRARIAFVDPTTHLVWLARFDPRAEAPMPLRTFAVVDELDLDWPGRTTDKLESARAVALSDGTILVTGIDEGISKAWVVDVGFGTVVAVDRSALPSAPAALLALADGVVAELGPNGSAVRRQILRTRFDNPPATLLPTDREWVAPDSTRGIAFDIEGVHSDRDARVVVPSLELAWFSLVLQAEAGVDIELFSEGPVNTTVHLRPEPGHGFEFGLVGCTVPWDGSSPVRLERRGTSLTIEAGERRTCTRQLSDRVQLAFRLAPTAALERVQIERLTTP